MSVIKDLKTKSTEVKPLQDHILVRPIEEDNVTESGIILTAGPESILDRPTHGEIIAIGPEVKIVKPGDIIYTPLSDGMDMELKDGEFVMYREKSILAVKG
jgi:chaperonin GroES